MLEARLMVAKLVSDFETHYRTQQIQGFERAKLNPLTLIGLFDIIEVLARTAVNAAGLRDILQKLRPLQKRNLPLDKLGFSGHFASFLVSAVGRSLPAKDWQAGASGGKVSFLRGK